MKAPVPVCTGSGFFCFKLTLFNSIDTTLRIFAAKKFIKYISFEILTI